MAEARKTPMVFFRTAAGSEPVRDWLKGMRVEARQAIGLDLMRAQFGWPVGMPLCRPMGDGLFEIRTDLDDGTTARVLICHTEGALHALHGFVKKTRKTPDDDLKLARRRKKDIEDAR